eukprot:2511092-Amphidinium_carterae.1
MLSRTQPQVTCDPLFKVSIFIKSQVTRVCKPAPWYPGSDDLSGKPLFVDLEKVEAVAKIPLANP